MSNTRELFKFPEELIFKLVALIVVDSRWLAEAWDEVTVYFVGGCVSGLVSCWIRLTVSHEVVDYDEDVLVTSRATFEVHEIYRH